LLRDALTLSAHLAVDQGRPADARRLATEALALTRPALGPLHRQSIGLGLLLSQIELNAGNAQQALANAAEARELSLQLHGRQRPHAATLDARLVYGQALIAVGRWDDAVVELTELLAHAQTLLGEQAAMPGFIAGHLARAELSRGSALAALQHAELSRRTFATSMQEQSFTMGAAHVYVGLAQLALMQGAQAHGSLAQADHALTDKRGEDSPHLRDVRALQALALIQQGRLDEAQQLLAPRLAAYRQTAAPFNFRGLHVAGVLQRWRGEFDAAEAEQANVLGSLPDGAANLPRRDAVLAEQARLALERGRAQRALDLLGRLARPPAAAELQSGDEADRLLTRGRALLALGRANDALPDLQAAWRFWTAHPALPRWRGEASHWLAQAWQAQGKGEDAAAARAQAWQALRDSPFPADRLLARGDATPPR
jgi:hypothetical protein